MNIAFDLSNFLPFMIRMILGIILFFQAYDKIFNLGLQEVGESALVNNKIRKLPKIFVNVSIWVSSYIEFIGGALLILGLFREAAFLVVGLNLIMVTLSFSYLRRIWDTQHILIRVVLLSALFLIPLSTDVFSIDYIIANFAPFD